MTEKGLKLTFQCRQNHSVLDFCIKFAIKTRLYLQTALNFNTTKSSSKTLDTYPATKTLDTYPATKTLDTYPATKTLDTYPATKH